MVIAEVGVGDDSSAALGTPLSDDVDGAGTGEGTASLKACLAWNETRSHRLQ